MGGGRRVYSLRACFGEGSLFPYWQGVPRVWDERAISLGEGPS